MRDAGKNGPNEELLGGVLDLEDSNSEDSLQTFVSLGDAANEVLTTLVVQRVAWLARMGARTPTLAAALTPLLFGEDEQ
jgi:hypothetical protein